MGKYVVALFCDLCKHSEAWNRIPKEKMVGLVGEYKALAEKVASKYGSLHANFTGDGHLFLFDNADAAVRFGLKVIAAWREEFGTSPALEGLAPIALRVGAHFGEDTQIGNGGPWIGRANNVAKRIEEAAEPDTVYVSDGILDLVDIPLYEFERVCVRKLKADCIPRRVLYRVAGFDEAASAAKPSDELTAEDWFLRAVAMIGTAKEGTDEEAACYQEALRLRPDFAEAHYNYGVLLRERGDLEGAEGHYVRALRLQPDDANAHYNYATLLKEKGDVKGAEEHLLEVLRLRPDYAAAHDRYGVLLAVRGDAKGAEEHFLEALRLRPDDAKAHYNYAILLQKKGNLEGAEGHYKEALRLRPDYAKAHYNYAILLQKKGDLKGAEEHYRRAYQIDPSDPDFKSAVERRAWER